MSGRRPTPRAVRKALDEMEVRETHAEPPVSPSPPEKPALGRPRSRPSCDDTDAIVILCGYLIGGMSMKKATALAECPHATEVYQRMAIDPDFFAIIARAREAQQDAYADETIDIADEANAENWQAKKLQIWARQWTASKMKPKSYGDKLNLSHSGGLNVAALPLDPRQLSGEQREFMRDILLIAPPSEEKPE